MHEKSAVTRRAREVGGEKLPPRRCREEVIGLIVPVNGTRFDPLCCPSLHSVKLHVSVGVVAREKGFSSNCHSKGGAVAAATNYRNHPPMRCINMCGPFPSSLIVDISDSSAWVAQLVERQPSKLNVAGSSLVPRSIFLNGKPKQRKLRFGFFVFIDRFGIARWLFTQ